MWDYVVYYTKRYTHSDYTVEQNSLCKIKRDMSMKFEIKECDKTPRITKLVDDLFKKMPQIEHYRAVLYTESFRSTEGEPIVLRKAKAFYNVCKNIPIVIRDGELIVGANSVSPRSCPTFPEFSFEWLESEFDTVATRSADPFEISEESKAALREVHKYWRGKTTSELATSYMAPEARTAFAHNMFTPGNYFYNGIGHVTVQYDTVINEGLDSITARAAKELEKASVADADYARRSAFLKAVIVACEAAKLYAARYAELAASQAAKEKDLARKSELEKIAQNCARVPAKPARDFWEACQSFWFVQQLLQLESSGHSISPGRFDQYMYPHYAADLKSGKITRDRAQELIDCIFVKLNDLNKVRDAASAEGFAGYSLFQNMIVGGQNADGIDVTNDLSVMCIVASKHVMLPQPSLSIRVWNGSPHELLIKAAELTRTGVGLPAYYNDEVIIPSLISRGLTMADARNYNIIGCVEPQCPGKTDGWHDAAFFNMCRPLEMVFSRGIDKGEQVGLDTGDVRDLDTYEKFKQAYVKQMNYAIELLVNADNAIDYAHMELAPLALESCLVDDCIASGKSLQEGGAVYNFTGPQGFGVANMGDALYCVKKLVFDQKKFTLEELKRALYYNFGNLTEERVADITADVVRAMQASGKAVSEKEIPTVLGGVISSLTDSDKKRFADIKSMIDGVVHFGNDDDEADAFAREAAYMYTRPLETYKNPRGGMFQAGLYPVSANVPLGAQTGATPDGRFAYTPVADGVSPTAGRDVSGPTATANSVSKLDHFIASNGTLFNQKFHPSALAGREGLEKFVALIRTYFDQKGSHMQFNVVSRETLLDAQKHPENYKHLVVRVAGYSALFTTLSRSLQDDIINRTEQAWGN